MTRLLLTLLLIAFVPLTHAEFGDAAYPFDKTVPQLIDNQKSGRSNSRLAREELAMRCGGFLALGNWDDLICLI